MVSLAYSGYKIVISPHLGILYMGFEIPIMQQETQFAASVFS